MFKRSLLATSILVLTACGGGGGGTTPPPTSGALALTTSNYTAAVQESLSSADYITRSSALLTGAQVVDDHAMVRAALTVFQRSGRWFVRAAPLATGVVTTEVEPCDNGGILTITINDQNGNNDADTGDSARAVATNCVIAGVTTNGTLDIVFTSVSGSFASPVFSVGATVTLDNFRAASAAGSAVGNGQIAVAINATGVNSQTFTLTVPSLTAVSTFGGTSSTRTLSSFAINAVTTPAGFGSSTAVSVNGTLSSTGLGAGTITIATTAPFVQSSSATYPSSGQLVVTGAANSKARATVQSGTTVLIELDADGNGAYETSTTRLWSQLI